MNFAFFLSRKTLLLWNEQNAIYFKIVLSSFGKKTSSNVWCRNLLLTGIGGNIFHAANDTHFSRSSCFEVVHQDQFTTKIDSNPNRMKIFAIKKTKIELNVKYAVLSIWHTVVSMQETSDKLDFPIKCHRNYFPRFRTMRISTFFRFYVITIFKNNLINFINSIRNCNHALGRVSCNPIRAAEESCKAKRKWFFG